MDLYAYSIQKNEKVFEYIAKNYGDIPRMRGVRFMKLMEAEPLHNLYDRDMIEQMECYNKYCGKDVIYIHTRCGGRLEDNWSNYVSCGGAEWEEENKDKFLEGINDGFDPTYRDHYFTAVADEEYEAVIEIVKEMMQETEETEESNE